MLDDPSDTWGHRVAKYNDVVGEFQLTSVGLVEQGAVRAVLRVESRFGESTLVEEFVLSSGARHVEVRVALDWREKLRMLKLRVPTAVASEHATYEVPYCHIERPTDGAEEVAQAWVDVSGPLPDGRRAGLSVLNDAKYGHDVLGGDVGISVARSPVYAWHEPKLLDPDGVYEYLDQGRQEFRYALLPHAGDWRAAGTVRLAAELNQPAFPLLESYHGGDLPQRASYLTVSEPSVVPTVLKLSEDGDGGVILRAHESAGVPVTASIGLPLLGRTVTADFGPHEIKTFRIPRDPDQPVVETNLLEWPEPRDDGHPT